MKDLHDHFKDKKITVMGLGLLGRGLGDAQFLAECGADVIVTDIKTAEELEESVLQLKPYKNVHFTLGGHNEKDFENRDLILVAAGVPLDSPYPKHAREFGIPITMSAVLLAELSQLPVIGVTGTRGKSTVTQLIAHTLREAGKEVLLGGNIRGVSNLQLLKEAESAEVLVLELDSWQLQGFGWSQVSPHISVFTNFMEDHQNYYPDMESYFADKSNIYKYQKPGDVLVVGGKVASDWLSLCPPQYLPVIPEPLPGNWTLQLLGHHNRENAALAKAALEAYGIAPDQIKESFASFAGVEGRLQLVSESGGVKIYNDNNATTPAATVVALESLDNGKQNVILIAGGADKGIDIAPLALAIVEHCRQVILTPGNGTDKLVSLLHGGTVGVSVVEDLKAAVAAARSAAAEGDSILFSPAFASFAQFKNEYDRNDQFMKLISAS